MSAERAIALLGFVVSLLLLRLVGPPALRAWRIYSGVPTRRMADAGPLEIAPPEPAAIRIAELAELGFTRIGERRITLPGLQVRYEWLVGEPSGRRT